MQHTKLLGSSQAADRVSVLQALFNALKADGYTVYPNDAVIGTGTSDAPGFDGNVDNMHIVLTHPSGWLLEPGVNLYLKLKPMDRNGYVHFDGWVGSQYDAGTQDLVSPVKFWDWYVSSSSNPYANEVFAFTVSSEGITFLTKRYSSATIYGIAMYFGRLRNFDYSLPGRFALVVSYNGSVPRIKHYYGAYSGNFPSGLTAAFLSYDSITGTITATDDYKCVTLEAGGSALPESPKVNGSVIRRTPVGPYPIDENKYLYFVPDSFFAIPENEPATGDVTFTTPDNEDRTYSIIILVDSSSGYIKKVALWTGTPPAVS